MLVNAPLAVLAVLAVLVVLVVLLDMLHYIILDIFFLQITISPFDHDCSKALARQVLPAVDRGWALFLYKVSLNYAAHKPF